MKLSKKLNGRRCTKQLTKALRVFVPLWFAFSPTKAQRREEARSRRITSAKLI